MNGSIMAIIGFVIKFFSCSQKKLVTWMRILVRNTNLIEYYYQPWSYVVKTGEYWLTWGSENDWEITAKLWKVIGNWSGFELSLS